MMTKQVALKSITKSNTEYCSIYTFIYEILQTYSFYINYFTNIHVSIIKFVNEYTLPAPVIYALSTLSIPNRKKLFVINKTYNCTLTNKFSHKNTNIS